MAYESRVYGVVTVMPGKFPELLNALSAAGFRWDDGSQELHTVSQDGSGRYFHWTGVAVRRDRLEGKEDWTPADALGRLVETLRRPEVTALLQEATITRVGEENDQEEWSYHDGVWYTDVEVGRATVPADVADDAGQALSLAVSAVEQVGPQAVIRALENLVNNGSEAKTGAPVYVLTIDTDDGPVVWVCRTEEAVWKHLEEYVRENWPGDRPFPDDLDEAVERYFVEGLDTYSIEQVTIDE